MKLARVQVFDIFKRLFSTCRFLLLFYFLNYFIAGATSILMQCDLRRFPFLWKFVINELIDLDAPERERHGRVITRIYSDVNN